MPYVPFIDLPTLSTDEDEDPRPMDLTTPRKTAPKGKGKGKKTVVQSSQGNYIMLNMYNY